MKKDMGNNVIRGKFLIIILASILLFTDFVIIRNINFLRPLLGIFILGILPGLVIVLLLRLDKLDFMEKFIFTVGISLSIIIIGGLFVDIFLTSLGFKNPLSWSNLLIILNIFLFFLFTIVYRRMENQTFNIPEINFNNFEKLFLIIAVFIPFLGIIGVFMLNLEGNNTILLLLVLFISIFISIICVAKNKISSNFYPLIIFSVSLTLILILPLRSAHIMGSDTFTEYYFFLETLKSLHWVPINDLTSTCISVTILPTIYQQILNISPETCFKFLYPVLFSISPLIVYQISKKYVGEFYGFLAALVFIFQINFLFTAFQARTNIAVLFFGLAIMTILNERIKTVKKRSLFLLFVISTILSHYSTAYIFFFFSLVAVVFGNVKEFFKVKNFNEFSLNDGLTQLTPILFFCLIFLWYSQVVATPFNLGIKFFLKTFLSLNNFFIVESRGTTIQTVLGTNAVNNLIANKIEMISLWTSSIFIIIGLLAVTFMSNIKKLDIIIFNKNRILNKLRSEFFSYIKNNFSQFYILLGFLSIFLLVSMFLVPFLSKGYSIDRLYSMLLIILSVFLILGGIFISKLIPKIKIPAYVLILIIIIPYFMSITGFTYNIFGGERSVLLNSKGENYDELFVHNQDVLGAIWIKNFSKRNSKGKINVNLYSDHFGTGILTSYAETPNSIEIFSLKNLTYIKNGSFIYLRYTSIVKGKLLDSTYDWHDINQYKGFFDSKNLIYDNGGSEVLN